MQISTTLEQQYTVMRVDGVLYCKLIELKWEIPEYQEYIVIKLAGLHIYYKCAFRKPYHIIWNDLVW